MKKLFQILLAIVLAYTTISGIAQNKSDDWNRIMHSGKIVEPKPKHNLNIYRSVIKLQLSSDCNFELVCPSFGTAMIKRYGLPKGYFLMVDRWIRDAKISVYETYPIRLTPQRKVMETVDDFHLSKDVKE